jgi:hypothetical protein
LVLRLNADSSPAARVSISNGRGPVMPVQLICPNLRCRKILAVPEDVRGKLVKCQHCQTMFRVPEPKKPAAPVFAGKVQG